MLQQVTGKGVKVGKSGSVTTTPTPTSDEILRDGHVVDIRPYLGRIIAEELDSVGEDHLSSEASILEMPWTNWVSPEGRGAILRAMSEIARDCTPAVRLFDYTVGDINSTTEFSDNFRLLFDRLDLGMYIHWHDPAITGSCTVYGFKQPYVFELLRWLCECDDAPAHTLKASIYGMTMGMESESIETMLNEQCCAAVEGA